jgi:GH24 family phage-related lysozyme (muramidase)
MGKGNGSAAKNKAVDHTTDMKLGNDGLQLIIKHEGFYSAMYNDAAGHCTVGYGHLIHLGKCGKEGHADVEKPFRDGVTKEQAGKLLSFELSDAVAKVNSKITAKLTQSQFDALVSLCYNIGPTAFSGSTVVKKINAGKFDEAPAWIKVWNKAGGKVVQGLVNRRADEVQLFNKK